MGKWWCSYSIYEIPWESTHTTAPYYPKRRLKQHCRKHSAVFKSCFIKVPSKVSILNKPRILIRTIHSTSYPKNHHYHPIGCPIYYARPRLRSSSNKGPRAQQFEGRQSFMHLIRVTGGHRVMKRNPHEGSCNQRKLFRKHSFIWVLEKRCVTIQIILISWSVKSPHINQPFCRIHSIGSMKQGISGKSSQKPLVFHEEKQGKEFPT